MRITAVDVIPFTLPLAKPIVMAHTTVDHSDNVLVKVTTGEGLVGWGEAVSAPRLTGDTQGGLVAAVEHLAPRLVGSDPARRTALWADLAGAVLGNRSAIGAIDIALHDLVGKRFGVAVVDLLGGRHRDEVPALTMVGTGNTDADVAAAADKHDQGYRWYKVKLGIGDAATELATMAGVRDAVGSESVLCADANGAWTEPEAVRFLRQLSGLDVAFVEQPIADGDPEGLVRIATGVDVPICVDESLHSLEDIVRYAGTGIAGVSLKLVKLGGLTGLMRGAQLCDHHRLNVNLAGKIAESSIAAAANVHAAAAMSNIRFGVSPGNQGLGADVTKNPVTIDNGSYRVPDGPGLGVEVDEDLVEALRS